MTRTTARRALAAVLTTGCAVLAVVAPAGAMPAVDGGPLHAAPAQTAPVVGDRPADRPSSSTARYQTPEVTQVVERSTTAPAVVGDRPADRPSSSTARYTTAELPTAPRHEAASPGIDVLPLAVSGGLALLVLALFGAFRMRSRPQRALARS